MGDAVSHDAQGNVVHTRKEDHWSHRWLPFMFTVGSTLGVIAFGYGLVVAEQRVNQEFRERTVEAMEQAVVRLRELERDAASREQRVGFLVAQMGKNEVNADVLAELAVDVGRAIERGDRNAINLQRLWNLARTNQGNTFTLADRVSELSASPIRLKMPGTAGDPSPEEN